MYKILDKNKMLQYFVNNDNMWKHGILVYFF